MDRSAEALEQVRALRKELDNAGKQAVGKSAAASAVRGFDGRAAEIENDLKRISARSTAVFGAMASGDAAPTGQAQAESAELGKALDGAITKWNTARTMELSAVNEQLRAAGLPPLKR